MITRYNESGRKITCNSDQIEQMEKIGYKLKENPSKTSYVQEKKTEVYKSTESAKIKTGKTSSTQNKNTRRTKKEPDIVL